MNATNLIIGLNVWLGGTFLLLWIFWHISSKMNKFWLWMLGCWLAINWFVLVTCNLTDWFPLRP